MRNHDVLPQRKVGKFKHTCTRNIEDMVRYKRCSIGEETSRRAPINISKYLNLYQEKEGFCLFGAAPKGIRYERDLFLF